MTTAWDNAIEVVASDKAAEVAVLSACLQSATARREARRFISREDFFHPEHEAIWSAMTNIDRASGAVDAVTVNAEVAGDKSAMAALLDVVLNQSVTVNVGHYAEIVRGWAVRRRLYNEASRARQMAFSPSEDAAGMATRVAMRFAQVRDSGLVEDACSITLDELMESEDMAPDWIIPGLLERRDRLILTGQEGLGKSFLLRQIAIMAAAGLHPFDHAEHITPARVLIVDCENSPQQVKRNARDVVGFARRFGMGNPGAVNLMSLGRINILRDKDLSKIHREMDVIQPDIVIIGPLYAMSPKALQTDDDAVPVLAALDSLRDTGAALLMEAHAGHALAATGTMRNLRPRGSSALLGWPEFGYGMRKVGEFSALLEPWRGDRDTRNWPFGLRRTTDGRWIPDEQLSMEYRNQ